MKKPFLLLTIFLTCTGLVHGIEPFVITDIRVEGLTRLEEGTVFNYLPLKVGDEVDEEETRLSIKELFGTGFFQDVQLEQDGTTLVVKVVERPSIRTITINGNREIKTEDIEQGLRDAGLIEGRIFRQPVLNEFERGLQNTYHSLGQYSASVSTSVNNLDDNRIDLVIDINEGREARIKQISIIGVEKEDLDDVLDEMRLKSRRGFALFSRKDQYSKQQLEADIESIRAFYLNRGYYTFEVISSSVEISPNKQDIFINIVLDEGEQYKFGETTIEGVSESDESEVYSRVVMKPGDVFSRAKISASQSAISDYYSAKGFPFHDIRVQSVVQEETRNIDTVITVVENRRVYVRIIDIVGNRYTRDEVIRREIRQLEGAWYSSALINLSKSRLQRLGLFESVTIETFPVPGTQEQVDLQVVVKERSTGSALASVGYSDDDGVLFGLQFQQRNLFGTGKELALSFNNSDAVEEISIEYTNPYLTTDGISRKISLETRDVDSSDIDTAEYILSSDSIGVNYRIPISETNSFNVGLTLESLELESGSQTPYEFRRVIDQNPNADQLIVNGGIFRDSRNDFFFPTAGSTGLANIEWSIPGSDFEYYKLNLQGSYYIPFNRMSLKSGLSIGYGDGYGDNSNDSGLPFFKNYFAGGSRTVRGYGSRSLGPKSKAEQEQIENAGITPKPTGGSKRLLLNMELLFPTFGAESKDKRIGLFSDGGWVWSANDSVEFGDMRYSAGLFFNWFSAIGPLTISYGVPLNEEDGDDIQELQISLGTVFR
ncbi:MAG: outer membrane protein assembly factor BamA [Gammaproteobacteria bacterium]|nr:outer membrane protein assembly factor BamA [Gammaproteobacteria bacterium]MCY4217776.1 outer membrane protein assembly factor BamA [Gammaproteobacteria bacterium]